MKKQKIAWIDNFHCNLFSSEEYHENGIDGLFNNLMRNGYLPLFMNESSLLDKGEVLVIIAPTKTYSKKETKEIKNFVKNGGLLLMSVGCNEKESVETLLETFEMDIEEMPLGPIPWITDTHSPSPTISQEDLEKYWHEPKFMEVYPLGCRGTCHVYASISYLGKTYDLIIGREYKKGRVILIGDSRFLLNENLEFSVESTRRNKPQYLTFWVGNIELINDIFVDFNRAGSLHEH